MNKQRGNTKKIQNCLASGFAGSMAVICLGWIVVCVTEIYDLRLFRFKGDRELRDSCSVLLRLSFIPSEKRGKFQEK